MLEACGEATATRLCVKDEPKVAAGANALAEEAKRRILDAKANLITAQNGERLDYMALRGSTRLPADAPSTMPRVSVAKHASPASRLGGSDVTDFEE